MSASRTILIADDAPIFRELGVLFLSRLARVMEVDSGARAIAMAQLERPDLVIVDFHMRGVDGETVCRAIKADPELVHTRVLVLLGERDPHERARAFRAGADDVIAKPLSRRTLIDTVKRYLQGTAVRGQPRIPLAIPVAVEVHEDAEADATRGTVRNLSRGGLYVEMDRPFAPGTELDLHFVLPESTLALDPTAEVLWRDIDQNSGSLLGMGMRFLEIDPSAHRQLDDYVFERTAVGPRSNLGAST